MAAFCILHGNTKIDVLAIVMKTETFTVLAKQRA